MNDMASVIVPKSDQLNSDDLIAGPMTITITGVAIRGGQEQPISVSFEGDNGKPYKPCKSMCRAMVTAWGADSKRYIGRSMTLFREPSVKWGGMEVGGIRISHMSDISSPLTMALTMTKGSRKPFTVRPLVASKDSASSRPPVGSTSSSADGQGPGTGTTADRITAEQIASIETRCLDNALSLADLKDAADVTELAQIPAKRFAAIGRWIDAAIAERKQAEPA